MDLGLEQPGAMEHLRSALGIIEDCRARRERLPAPADLGLQGTALYPVISNLPDCPVDPRISLVASLDSSLHCLEQIAIFIQENGKTTPEAMATMMRTALLAGCRPVFMLGLTDPDKRRMNILRLMFQDGSSLGKFFKTAKDFDHLRSLVPPPEILEVHENRIATLRSLVPSASRLSGEAPMLDEVAEIVGELVVSRDDAPEASARILTEHLSLMFNAYSGAAHGYGWPKLIHFPSDLPGDFVADFYTLATFTQLSLDLTEKEAVLPESRR